MTRRQDLRLTWTKTLGDNLETVFFYQEQQNHQKTPCLVKGGAGIILNKSEMLISTLKATHGEYNIIIYLMGNLQSIY